MVFNTYVKKQYRLTSGAKKLNLLDFFDYNFVFNNLCFHLPIREAVSLTRSCRAIAYQSTIPEWDMWDMRWTTLGDIAKLSGRVALYGGVSPYFIDILMPSSDLSQSSMIMHIHVLVSLRRREQFHNAGMIPREMEWPDDIRGMDFWDSQSRLSAVLSCDINW